MLYPDCQGGSFSENSYACAGRGLFKRWRKMLLEMASVGLKQRGQGKKLCQRWVAGSYRGALIDWAWEQLRLRM